MIGFGPLAQPSPTCLSESGGFAREWWPLGLRLGDAWAFTQVIDGKVVAGAAELADSAQAIRAPGQLRELPNDGELSRRGNRCASP